MTERTPGLWSIDGPDQFGDYNIHHPGDRLAIGAVVSNMRPADEVAANAEFIVTAVNSHDALLAENKRMREALTGLLAGVEDGGPWGNDDQWQNALSIARAALSRIDTPEPPVDRDDKKRITDLEAACLAAKSLLEPTDDRTEMAWQLLDEAYHERKLFTGISTGRDPIAKEDDGWRPIESAPRDGSSFWGRCGNDAVSMFWHEGFGEFISSFRRMTLADGYTFKNGATFEDHSPAIHKPTGWRPRLASADSTDTVTDPIADAVAKENEGE